VSLALGIHKLCIDDSIHLKFLFKNVGANKGKKFVYSVRVRACVSQFPMLHTLIDCFIGNAYFSQCLPCFYFVEHLAPHFIW
jgi:hypothetical protein